MMGDGCFVVFFLCFSLYVSSSLSENYVRIAASSGSKQ